MTSDELMHVVDTVREEKLSHAQASIRFGISKTLVSRLVSQFRKDSSSFDKATKIDDRRRRKLRAIIDESNKI